MTVKDLYKWAEEHNCLDLELYKNVQLDMYPVQECYLFSFDLGNLNFPANTGKLLSMIFAIL